jgi:hypothetical protein
MLSYAVLEPRFRRMTAPNLSNRPGLPAIELAQLARPIDRALERPWSRREQRPHFAQIVIDDRLAAIKALLRDQLADALTRQLRVPAQQPMDLVLERVQLRARPRALVLRRLVALDRVADRVAMQPGAPVDLPLRQAAHEVQPPDLRPLLHSDHLGPPDLALRKRTQASEDHRTLQVAHISTGAGGPVFTRRR